MSVPVFKLSRLRDIGWAHWDPIGLVENRFDCDDEYDQYLLQAAAKIWSGLDPYSVQEFLKSIESGHMGLGAGSDASDRACATVEALREYVTEIRG